MTTAICDLEELRKYDSEWRKLAERRGNPFLTPEWFRCWFDHYESEAAPFVPVARGRSGKLLGLFPLALGRSGYPRVCRIAGADLGDHYYPLSEPGDESEVGAAVGEALASAPQPWSILALDHVDLQGRWLAALSEGTGFKLRIQELSTHRMPLIDLVLHESWDAYLETRSPNDRRQIRKNPRRLAKRHSVRVRRTERAEEVRADMSTFFDLHARRLGRTSLADERAQAFHLDFAAAAFGRGWLRLWFLVLDDQPVATLYGLRVGHRYLVYNSGFDPRWAKYGPGVVLLSAALQSAFEEGASEFDLLLGDEPYKYRFADNERTVSDIALARSLPHPASLVVSARHGATKPAALIRPRTRRTMADQPLADGRASEIAALARQCAPSRGTSLWRWSRGRCCWGSSGSPTSRAASTGTSTISVWRSRTARIGRRRSSSGRRAIPLRGWPWSSAAGFRCGCGGTGGRLAAPRRRRPGRHPFRPLWDRGAARGSRPRASGGRPLPRPLGPGEHRRGRADAEGRREAVRRASRLPSRHGRGDPHRVLQAAAGRALWRRALEGRGRAARRSTSTGSPPGDKQRGTRSCSAFRPTGQVVVSVRRLVPRMGLETLLHAWARSGGVLRSARC